MTSRICVEPAPVYKGRTVQIMLNEGAAKLQIRHDTQQHPASDVVSLTDMTRPQGVKSSHARAARKHPTGAES
jgi:hypothetical protein